jgi:hypothetical protein
MVYGCNQVSMHQNTKKGTMARTNSFLAHSIVHIYRNHIITLGLCSLPNIYGSRSSISQIQADCKTSLFCSRKERRAECVNLYYCPGRVKKLNQKGQIIYAEFNLFGHII